MNTFLRRIAAAFSLASLALSWPLAFASAQTAPALTKKVAFIGDSQATNLVCPALSNEQTITNSASLMDVRDNKIPKVLKQLGIESVAAKCRVAASTNWQNSNSQAFINNLPEDLDAIIVFSGGNDCNGLPNTCTNCSNHATEIPALLEKLNARRPKKIIWFTTFWVDATAVANEIHICANHIFPSYLASLSSRFPALVPVNGWELTTDGIPRSPGDAHYNNAEYYYPTLSPRLSQKIAEIVGAGAGTSVTDADDPTVPVTDAIGRSQDEIQQNIAARCADTNPVFPVRLGIAIGGTTEVNGLTEYINVVYRYMTAIVLVVAIVMVTVGGFKYLLAASPLGVKDGKDVIKNGIVGMVLVLSAYVILNTINPATTVLQFTKPPEDIICRNYEASLGLSIPGGNDQCSEATQERDCGPGRRCVMTNIVFQNVTEGENLATLAAGVGAGAYVGGPLGASVGGVASIGTMFYRAVDGVHKCTDGEIGSPCAEDEDCSNGNVCAADWNICLPTSGNPRGGPCDPARNNMCESGSTCAVTDDAWFEDWGICRGTAQQLTWAAITANNYRAPENTRCVDVQDCARTGTNLRCVGPAGTGKKYCIEAGRTESGIFTSSGVSADDSNPTPCFIIDGTVNGIVPGTCQGTAGSQHACVICAGDNKWRALNLTSDPEMVRIGQCADRAKIGTACRR